MDIKALKQIIKDRYSAGGPDMRWALLAYAFARGVPYRQLELKAHNEDAHEFCRRCLVRAVAHVLSGSAEPIYRWRDEEAERRVREWIAVPATAEMTARSDQERERVLARKRARYAELHRESVSA